MILCGSCSLPLKYSYEWHAWVHAVLTASECLRALKCPAFLNKTPQPYAVAPREYEFDDAWWSDRMARERRP